MHKPKYTPQYSYDAQGIPAVWANNVAAAYQGIGFLHGRHRPMQALVLATAARGQLAHALLPRHGLVLLDSVVHRLDIPGRAAAEEMRLDAAARHRLDAYLAGFAQALASRGMPWETRALVTRLPPLDRQAVLGSLVLSAFLGLAECQEHMERALVECLAAGGDARIIEAMFGEALVGWDPDLLRQVSPKVDVGFPGYPLRAAGGSNAWAVGPTRTASGKAILCGDPHLQINTLPSLFFEVRVRVGEDYWLGATIPGLPAIAVGRNRFVAWSGTFAVADNVDLRVEQLQDGAVMGADGPRKPTVRHVWQRRRFLPPKQTSFYSTEHGMLQHMHHGKLHTLSVRWAALEGAASTLGACLHLPCTHTAEEAARTLQGAQTLSLHYVLADSGGALRYQQAGRIPRRTGNWSGLYPVAHDDPRTWDGVLTGARLPHGEGEDDILVSANEARPASDGSLLATLHAPPYRYRRIHELLSASRQHTIHSMQALQRDVLSLQGLTLKPWLLQNAPQGRHAQTLAAWDGQCHAESVGAHAFDLFYQAARAALAPSLGGAWWHQMLKRTEIGVWWCRGIDTLLQRPETWRGTLGDGLRESLAKATRQALLPWGDVRPWRLKHLMFGDAPDVMGLNRGPYPLVGSLATVQQGSVVPTVMGEAVVGPAYRMICDFACDDLLTSLPGGIDGAFGRASYTRWLDEWRTGGYHKLVPPSEDEARVPS